MAKKITSSKTKSLIEENKNSANKYNKLIKKYNGLIKNKKALINQATLAQLEKDAAASVNAIQAPNNISPAMKQQLNEVRKHMNTVKKLIIYLAKPFNTSGTRRRRRLKRRRTRNNKNNKNNRRKK